MSHLKIQNFAVQVRLGCTKPERAVTQKVLISLELFFTSAPQACHTDKLHDTLCYEDLCRDMKLTTSQNEFQTIEHLSHSVLEDLKKDLHPSIQKLVLHVHKVNPPIDGLEGGVVFVQDWTR